LDQLSEEFGGTHKVLKDTDEKGTYLLFEMLETIGGPAVVKAVSEKSAPMNVEQHPIAIAADSDDASKKVDAVAD
jgi:hypothetical protein